MEEVKMKLEELQFINWRWMMDIAEEIWNIVVKTWLTKAHNRRLIKDEEFEHFMKDLDTIGIKLNNYINSPGKKHNDNK
jgi:hypothetical protein